ncbi:MAG: hypothetical protein LWW76_09205 [Burkholderiales bacterium]|nr:hypothetical protein [Burkholderiales bacterium]
MKQKKFDVFQQDKFADFPQDGHLWRIDMIDHTSYSIEDEPRIRVYFSRLKEECEFDKALNKGALFQDDDGAYCFVKVDIKVGFLQLIDVGTVWRNGVQQLNFVSTNLAFGFDPKDAELVKLAASGAHLVQTDPLIWEAILTDKQYCMANPATKKRTYAVVLRGHERYKKIIIPCSVIFKSCYVTSEKAASKMLFGQMDKLVDLKFSDYYEDEPNTFQVCIHRDYTNDEGTLFANLLTDPAAQKGLNMLRQNLVLQSNVLGDAGLIPLKVGFPFSNHVHLDVVGKNIGFSVLDQFGKQVYLDAAKKEKMPDERGFFVTAIRNLKTKFQFETLVPVRKNSGDKGKNKASELIGLSYGGGNSFGNDSNSEMPNEFIDDEPTKRKPKTKANIPSIIDLADVKIIKKEKDFQRYVNKPLVKKPTEGNVEGSSTGPARDTKDGASELNIVLSPVTLDSFFELITCIRARGIKIDTIPVCNSRQTHKGIINHFPWKIKGCYSWHLTEDKARPRTFIVATFVLAGVSYCLIDVEAKKTGAMAIAMIRAHDGSEIGADLITRFMKAVANANGWIAFQKYNAHFKNWSFTRFDHSRKGNIESVANLIINATHKL